MAEQKTLYPIKRADIIAGIPIANLVRYGTPVFVYDASVIEQRIKDLSLFETVRYAQKACSNIAILKFMREHGVKVDAVSAMEIRRALAAGYSVEPDPSDETFPIVYTADVFDQDALDLIAGEAPVHVNCGSLDMISQLGERAPGREITLRINPGFGHGHSQKTNTGGESSKHGIWFEQLDEAKRLADQYNMKIVGLHMHIGSGTDFEHLARVTEAMRNAVMAFGGSIRIVSCGGGLPVPYKDGETYVDLEKYHRLWLELILELEQIFGDIVHLEIEPGRYLVAESCCLISRICAIKQQKNNLFYLIDAGFNNLARPIMYGSWHPISIIAADGRDLGPEIKEVIVGGPLCESGDIFTQEEGGFVAKRNLPAAKVGDWLVLEVAGAYGSAMSSNYNSKLLAPEILIKEGQAILIRKRQTFEHLIANEIF